MVEPDVRAAVEAVIRDRLNMVRIVSVETIRDEGFDGDDVLRVRVVVDSPASDFDPERLSSLVRYLRPKLAEHKERAFPLISFIAKADAKAFAL